MSGKDVVRAFYRTVWSEGRLDEADRYLAPDLVDHDVQPFPGRADGAAGLLQVVGMIRAALPDLERSIEDQIEEGDRVVTRFVDRGTHRGELFGVPPTGRAIRLPGINIERVEGGRIREIWHIEDLAGLMRQIS
jgi:steroid delta-isomerase-like uncharacterized protein